MTVVAGSESDTRRYQHLSPAVVVVIVMSYLS